MATKKITISIPIEYADYLEQRTISPSKLLQKAIKEIMAHDVYYRPITTEKVKTYGKPKYNRTNGKRPRERRNRTNPRSNRTD